MDVGIGGVIMPPVEALLRAATRAEEKGYDSLWWPDHWMGWHPESIWTPDVAAIANYVPNPHVFLDPVAAMSAVAVHTSRARLGTSVTEPLRRHPALLAHEWLSLDHLSKGRAILGIGAGEAENNVPYGIDYGRQVTKLEEALRIIRLLWSTTEPVDFDGEFWPLRDAVCGMGSYGDAPPPIWLGALGPRMLDICGRLADGWMPTVMMPVDVYAERLDAVRAAAKDAGRDPAALDAVVYAMCAPALDHDEAHRIIGETIPRGYPLVASNEIFARHGATHPWGEGFYGIRDYIPTRVSREEGLRAIEAVPFEVAHDFFVHGTADEIAAEVAAYEPAGATHVILQNVTPLGDPTKAGETFRVLDEVLRALKP